jgi:hypothetical protein
MTMPNHPAAADPAAPLVGQAGDTGTESLAGTVRHRTNVAEHERQS